MIEWGWTCLFCAQARVNTGNSGLGWNAGILAENQTLAISSDLLVMLLQSLPLDWRSKSFDSASGGNLGGIRCFGRRLDCQATLIFDVDAAFHSLGPFLEL